MKIRDANNNLLFKLKSNTDIYDYSFDRIDPETGKKEVIKFQTKEKRIVSYNPYLAAKQKAEIMKLARVLIPGLKLITMPLKKILNLPATICLLLQSQ
jgi:hypothetical protein